MIVNPARLENYGKKLGAALPGPLARQFKRLSVYPRYWLQRQRAAHGFRQYGERYPHPFLFIAGLPKSGTTWLELMVSSFPGYELVAIPEPSLQEYRTGGTHRFELPRHNFERFGQHLVLSKLHCHGSAHNVALLRRHNIPVVMIYRDLRDVAVSHCFYVSRTPWHPEYRDYASRSIDEGLVHFGNTLLPEYVRWVDSWQRYADAGWLLVLRYEDLVADTPTWLSRVARHFSLNGSPETIERIAEDHSFDRMRQRYEEAVSGDFFRRGRSGDWRNHFSRRHRALFKEHMGDFLTRYGYEENRDW